MTLPGVVRPMALGFKTGEIQRLLSLDVEGVLSGPLADPRHWSRS
jgi:hypothetical protein